jgi:hypothetical protein
LPACCAMAGDFRGVGQLCHPRMQPADPSANGG